MQIVPTGKPKIAPSLALKILLYFFSGVIPEFAIIGIRGYYANMFGAKNANDVGVYDDAIIVVWKGQIYAFNANCDPSVLIKSGQPKAILKKGLHLYKLDYHHKYENGKRYVALRPATKDEVVPVWRTAAGNKLNSSTGQAINIHQGGLSGTWSEGCQTIYYKQYAEFITLVGRALGYKVPLGVQRKSDPKLPLGKFSYVLIDFQDMTHIQDLPEADFQSIAEIAYRARNFVNVPVAQPKPPVVRPLPDFALAALAASHDDHLPAESEETGFAEFHAAGSDEFEFDIPEVPSLPAGNPYMNAPSTISANNPPIDPLNQGDGTNNDQGSTASAASGNGAGAAVPAGDAPEEPAKTFLSVEDWKPWVFSQIKKIWGGFFGGNFSQMCVTGVTALKSGEYWYVPLIIGVLIAAVSFIFCAFVTIVVLGIWYFNRKEIVHFKTLEAESRLDPDKSNLQINIEKIRKAGFFGLKRVFRS